jgi:hypothetical protein
MWYIMQADEGSNNCWIQEDSNSEFLEKLKKTRPYSILDSVNVKEGMYFSRNRNGTR